MRYIWALSFALCLISGSAFAQTTYRYVSGPQTTFSNTDWMVLGGSSANPAKTVQVTNIFCSGTAPIPATIDVWVVRRSTADTGGTASSVVAANWSDTTVPATSTMSLYTAPPTSLGTPAGAGDSQKLNVGPAGSAGYVSFDYGTRLPAGPLFVRQGPTHQVAINFNGATLPTGLSLSCRWELVEQ